MLSPIEGLKSALKNAIAANKQEIDGKDFGDPGALEKAKKEVEKIFGEITKPPRANDADAKQAALEWLRGTRLPPADRDLVASALCLRHPERRGESVIGSPRLPILLKEFSDEAERGELWIVAWIWLLQSFYAFKLDGAPDSEKAGWAQLATTLQQTWPAVRAPWPDGGLPTWMALLDDNPELLTDRATHRYAKAQLAGDDSQLSRLEADFRIPPVSWFYDALVLGAVKELCAEKVDSRFKEGIARALEMIDAHVAYRDEALVILLKRFHACADKSEHELLRDYVVRRDVWKNPRLRSMGAHTGWSLVAEPVWRMALGWVNANNLEVFFEVTSRRRRTERGRLEFWRQYIQQISAGWTRLVIGSETERLAGSNDGVKRLLEQEAGAYARLSQRDDDAFIMQIGDYLIVEFCQQPNASYVYRIDRVPFDRYQARFDGSTARNDLKAGFYDPPGYAARITHEPGWEPGAMEKLRTLGIVPDATAIRPRGGTARPKPPVRPPVVGATSSDAFEAAKKIVAESGLGYVLDMRDKPDGCFWVFRLLRNSNAASQLEELGFRWSEKRSGYYLKASALPAMTRRSLTPATLAAVNEIVTGYGLAHVADQRTLQGGRYWVLGIRSDTDAARRLESLGFAWSSTRCGYYFNEDQ